MRIDSIKILIAFVLLLLLVACQPVENTARDAIAAGAGAVAQAQNQYLATCTTDKSQAVCQIINRGVSAENAAITAVETYCGWSTVQVPIDPNTKCVPVKSAKAALQSAVANLQEITKEIRGILPQGGAR